jgi:hypothetical protein
VRGSPEILVHVGAVGAKGRVGKGPLRGLWRLAVCGGDSHRCDARVRVGGRFRGRRCRSAWRRFSMATTTPRAVPKLEAKACSQMTPRGARGWLL